MIERETILEGRVAVVGGASRGCGRGLALALGSAGATVYVTARTARSGPKPIDLAPGTIEDTAAEVDARGGCGIPVAVDYTDPEQVEELFTRVERDQGRLDIAACAVWGGNERYLDPVWKRPFWEQPASVWPEAMGPGPYAFWLTARSACRVMAPRESGLIAAISEPILEGAFEGQQPSLAETLWRLAHSNINGLVTDLSRDAHKHGIAIVGVLPGFMKTERVEMHIGTVDEASRAEFRYDLAESTEFSGRALAALAADPRVLERSGKLLYVADLAEEYGFTDVDGRHVSNFYRTLGFIP